MIRLLVVVYRRIDPRPGVLTTRGGAPEATYEASRHHRATHGRSEGGGTQAHYARAAGTRHSRADPRRRPRARRRHPLMN